MAKWKRYPVQMWFLSDDPAESASFLTDKLLAKTIYGCYQALVAARLYFSGIHSAKMWKAAVSPDLAQDTMDKLFPDWPLKQRPRFQQYSSRESKWTRKCGEHMRHVETYLQACLDEWLLRKSREHGLAAFADWHRDIAPKLRLPDAGIKKIVPPWKNLNPKHRRRDVIAGYRAAFCAQLSRDPLAAYAKTKRDVPDFVLQYFKLDVS